jgi:hypothetical protein
VRAPWTFVIGFGPQALATLGTALALAVDAATGTMGDTFAPESASDDRRNHAGPVRRACSGMIPRAGTTMATESNACRGEAPESFTLPLPVPRPAATR